MSRRFERQCFDISLGTDGFEFLAFRRAAAATRIASGIANILFQDFCFGLRSQLGRG